MIAQVIRFLSVRKQQHKAKQEDESSLPHKISSKILQFYMECQQGRLTRENLTWLVHYYSLAVYHYESIEDIKYKYYQKRIKEILKNPTHQAVLSGDNLRYVKDRVEEVRKERLIKYYARGRMEEIEIMDRRSFGGSSTKTVRKAHAVAPKLNISEISLKKN